MARRFQLGLFPNSVSIGFLILILGVAVLSRAADTAPVVGLWKNEDATFEIFEDQG